MLMLCFVNTKVVDTLYSYMAMYNRDGGRQSNQVVLIDLEENNYFYSKKLKYVLCSIPKFSWGCSPTLSAIYELCVYMCVT